MSLKEIKLTVSIEKDEISFNSDFDTPFTEGDSLLSLDKQCIKDHTGVVAVEILDHVKEKTYEQL